MRSILQSKIGFALLLLVACSRFEDPLKDHVFPGKPISEEAMERLMDRYHVPGVSVAVVHQGKIDWAKGYGVLEYGRKDRVDTTTLFQAASISKPVSAVAALRMVDRGELTLDEDVNQRLRSWKVPENQFTKVQRVTLRRLLSHSAGLTMHGVPEYSADVQLPTLVQILDGTGAIPNEPVRVTAEPGSRYRYSGGGYIILQVLMSDVSGRPFKELVQEYVLTPAGMRSSTFAQPLPKELSSRAAVGHLINGKPLGGRWHTLPELATGGLWTTPTDLALFAIELRKSYLGTSHVLLSRHRAGEMGCVPG